MNLTDELARLLASIRVPPSTVYMDGSHNPTPSEQHKAAQFVRDHLTPTRPTLNDLWNLAYFSGKDVRLEVVGGHETIQRVVYDGLIYEIPADSAELLAEIDGLR
jgi:hypothetical protein